MSTRSNWTHLDPLTRILLLLRSADWSARFDCGCRRTSDVIVLLCDYHEGFEDGAKAVRREKEER